MKATTEVQIFNWNLKINIHLLIHVAVVWGNKNMPGCVCLCVLSALLIVFLKNLHYILYIFHIVPLVTKAWYILKVSHGDEFQLWKITRNILNKHLETANKRYSSSSGDGWWARNVSEWKTVHYKKLYKGSQFVGSHKHENEFPAYMRDEFLEQQSNYRLLKKDCFMELVI
jgi:hypothetical protein